ncbi:beta-ketoacyl synthase N-terminal-like domain-containing protein [Desulfopila sp. IMCC35008]|uniref:beta-ketoacyl synthase N-terminal-like domain-containing protein n=1 Tax=Desulfopila sp. IMCC35008 TaxID=2653858 RepID=UPI0013D3EA84|nr:beta-ketoacyl synthase N-terminal-like domain-containing protein [Desulfopila sp. IMCC35008]
MRKVLVTAGDICTPLGDLASTWSGLVEGQQGVSLRSFGSVVEPLPLAVIDKLTGLFGSHERQESLFDLLCDNLPDIPQNTRLYCATTKAAADELALHGPDETGQPWQVAKYLAERLGLTRDGITVSAACVSSLIAMIRGAMDIRSGRCDHVLVIGFDLLSDFVVTGFSSLKALSPKGARPFDRNRDGLTLGDGGGWVLLSSGDSIAGGGKGMAEVAAWSISCDATHITAPSRDGVGLLSVFREIMAQHNGPVGGINAHGTATFYNDAMELLVFRKMLAKGTPVCSVKGSLGHSLGAAGLVEAMLSVQSLVEGLLPPTVGLCEPEETDCLLSGNRTLPLMAPSIISCNSGFGGINAGLLLTPLDGS